MSDEREKLRKMFDPAQREKSFGNMITRMTVRGVRCHRNTVIDFQYPITALTGVNGTGKSTLLQLAAVAYRNDGHPYYIGDFMVHGTLDPAPFTTDARIEYQIWRNPPPGGPQDRAKPLQRTIARRDTGQWGGYRERPDRPVLLFGVSQYLPRFEQHDFLVREARRLQVIRQNAVSDEVKKWLCTILGCEYGQVITNTVRYTRDETERENTVVSVAHHNVSYSEAHMGYGEGRVQHLITTLENVPERSLVLIEEPETALHPRSQYQVGCYLIDVAYRRRHQILLTTHSPYLLGALPDESRIYLKWQGDSIVSVPRLSAPQIRSLLSEGHDPVLDVLVEDDCGEALLRELVRTVDPDLLTCMKIHVVGGGSSVLTATLKALAESRLPIATVLDADQPSYPKENIFKLPGPSKPPEKAMFEQASVKELITATYRIDLGDFVAGVGNLDHHGWLDRLATRLNQHRSVLLGEMARAFAGSYQTDAYALAEQLKAVLR
jgi:predicted ATPase